MHVQVVSCYIKARNRTRDLEGSRMHLEKVGGYGYCGFIWHGQSSCHVLYTNSICASWNQIDIESAIVFLWSR